MIAIINPTTSWAAKWLHSSKLWQPMVLVIVVVVVSVEVVEN